MPVWHETTKQWVEDEKLVVLGVVQEQHAERAQLYAQWRELDWPIVQDSLNLMNIGVVPLTIAIDESGYVRSHRPLRGDFMSNWFEKGAPSSTPTQSTTEENATGGMENAQQILLWKSEKEIDSAVDLLKKHLSDSPDDAVAHFQMGVALRQRYDQSGNPEDFQEAVNHWSRALELNPRQYIYRRRIQQFGPRLDKPYPFYDWVEQAQADIAERGDEPVVQKVTLTESEIAKPSRNFSTTSGENPDPNGQLAQDKELVDVNVVVVPRVVAPGDAARVHVILNNSEKSKWNNEADPTQIWIESPGDAQVDVQYIVNESPASAESEEERRLEFEVRMPKESAGKEITIKAFALYTVCRQDNGQCVFLRQDFEVPLTIAK